MAFKVTARRNKFFGLWAAAALNKTDAEAEAYAQEVIKADFEEAGDEDVFRKVSGDLGDKASEDDVREKMVELLAEAKAQLMDEL